MLPPAQRRNASVRGGDWRGDTGVVHEAVQLGRRSCGANRRGNEGLCQTGDREGRRAHVQYVSRTVPLTVKLNGRAEAPDGRRGRTLPSGARGAQPPTHHGPFQRLLEDALTQPTVRARFPQRKPCPRAQRNFSLNRSRICDKRS